MERHIIELLGLKCRKGLQQFANQVGYERGETALSCFHYLENKTQRKLSHFGSITCNSYCTTLMLTHLIGGPGKACVRKIGQSERGIKYRTKQMFFLVPFCNKNGKAISRVCLVYWAGVYAGSHRRTVNPPRVRRATWAAFRTVSCVKILESPCTLKHRSPNLSRFSLFT